MPEVRIYATGGNPLVREVLAEETGEAVAEELSCWVWRWKWPFIRFEELDRDSDVDVIVFWDAYDPTNTEMLRVLDIYSTTRISIEISAFNYLDRRRNIHKRLARIVGRLKANAERLDDDEYAATITFRPVKRRHWTKA